MFPLEVANLLRQDTLIVVDNARMPAHSATASAPQLPSLCPCGRPTPWSATGSRPTPKSRSAAALQSSRWESIPGNTKSSGTMPTRVIPAKQCFQAPAMPLRMPFRPRVVTDCTPCKPQRRSSTQNLSELLKEALNVTNMALPYAMSS